MSLERFRRSRMVVLKQRSLAYQAVRAMQDNHIGAVLVSGPEGLVGIVTDRDLALAMLGGDVDPDEATLGEIMSEDLVTCDIGASLDYAARLMVENRIRRIPLTEDGHLVGFLTFDDLVLDGSIEIATLRRIVTAQLEVEAPKKPAGMLYPQGTARPEQRAAGRSHALMRAKVRAEETYNRLVRDVASRTNLNFELSERALIVTLCMVCRRLLPEEALDLIAQLPSKLHSQMDQCLDGPERAVTADALKSEVARVVGLRTQEAIPVLNGIFSAISNIVSAGQIDEVRGQLPDEMKDLLPKAA